MASREWPAVRILAENQDKYQIQWEGDWLPTWEPKANASERLVVDWVQQRRGGGPSCYYAARCILRETPKHYLVEWCPDECTGERYAPTWVHKKAATRALVAEWNKMKEEEEKKKKKKGKTTTTRRKRLAARTSGERRPSSRHHDDDATPANQEPPPQPLPLSPPKSSPPSAHLGLVQQQQQQQQLQLQLQLDAAESENGSSRRDSAPSAELRKFREQPRRQAYQQTPPASAVETMTEKQGEADQGAWWDGMPDLSRKSVYGRRKRLFY